MRADEGEIPTAEDALGSRRIPDLILQEPAYIGA
jgi:hypothetical protein